MSADPAAKGQLVRANLEKLARIPQASYAEFASDFRNTEAALHLLQTSGPPPAGRFGTASHGTT